MPRVYKKKLGPSSKRNYDPKYIENAKKAVRQGMSIRRASEMFGVPYATLNDHISGRHPRSYGGQTVLSNAEEKCLVEGLALCAEWGFPQRRTDVRNMVQNYLNRSGKVEKRFTNNRPGIEWFSSFLRRNPNLTERMCENVKRVRAGVNRETLNEYFDNLEVSLQGIPPSNIINFDETNFCDDPGQVKVVSKRGVKHVERIVDTSKTSISVMMAAAANGDLLPPYIVYKAKHLYPTWTENGVPGAAYNRNASGWFDLPLFDDWFEKILLPFVKKLEGRKAIIGDNLSSHLSLHVIKLCRENNINFILLPPNSTHICQPLDVSFFRPLKMSWRIVLDEWKKITEVLYQRAFFHHC